MPGVSATLPTPVLLVAMPQVLDPFFHHSVVLLVRHEEEGSFGVIVNRPTGIKVSEILKGMEVSWQGRDDAVAHFGGPVQPSLGTVLFGPPPTPPAPPTPPTPSTPSTPLNDAEDSENPEVTPGFEGGSEVADGVSLTQHVGDLSRLAAAPPEQLRLFLGYAGWGAGQLIEEILRNDWLTAPVRSDLIFAPDPDRIWAATLESVGVDPATLPSWTHGSHGEETAN